jgi:hypothetical protein
MTLKDFITDPKTGRPIRGAITRVAEFQNLSSTQVRRIIDAQERGIGIAPYRVVMLEEMFKRGIRLFEKNSWTKKNRLAQNGKKRLLKRS